MIRAGSPVRTRVLVVDDSAVARDLIERGLSRDPAIEVVGKAADVYSARDKIVLLKPDVVTLDVEMPRMDGIEFLKRLMPQYPIPVIVVSAVAWDGSTKALEALDAGAVAVVSKPSSAGGPSAFLEMLTELAERIKEASKVRIRGQGPAAPAFTRPKTRIEWAGGPPSRTVIAIGASTGGTTALRTVIQAFPQKAPGTLVVQHMPPVFTRMFAESLDRESA
ncbi:MAG TPA: response regulator, partial [Magnetospirillaceae bacterium]|nr:response regulator [Magnetospirillaceae bacterium]